MPKEFMAFMSFAQAAESSAQSVQPGAEMRIVWYLLATLLAAGLIALIFDDDSAAVCRGPLIQDQTHADTDAMDDGDL